MIFFQNLTKVIRYPLRKYDGRSRSDPDNFKASIELTEESVAACEKLVNAGVPVGNQAVILAGINDDTGALKWPIPSDKSH
jgi:lysine 2,3-aminomutase